MICPVCNRDMIVVEHHQIELDYCTRCHGVWFDSGEIELLLKCMGKEDCAQLLSNTLRPAETRTKEKRHKCPICNQKMKKTSIGQPPGIMIDACRKGDGLWFDGGELGQLLKQAAEKPGPQPELTGFLAEVFKASDKDAGH